MLQQLIVDIVLPWLILEVSEWQRFLFNAMILPFSHFSRNLRSCQAPAASHIDQRDISAFRRPCFTAPCSTLTNDAASSAAYTRKIAQVVTSLQTSCNKSVHKLSTSCVRTACS